MSQSNTNPIQCDDQLFVDKHQMVLDYYRAGMSVRAACRAVGISPSTFGRWRKRGEAELARMDSGTGKKGKKIKSSEVAYVLFVREYRTAQGEKAGKAELIVFEGATKGFTVEEQKTIRVFDEAGQLKGSQEETKIKKLPPDMRAAQWWLQHNDEAQYGPQAQRVEVEDVTPETGPRKTTKADAMSLIGAISQRKVSADLADEEGDDVE